MRVQQHERWDTHDAQLAETRIGADDDGNDIIIPMYDYALTYTGVGDLADQLEAIADAEERCGARERAIQDDSPLCCSNLRR